MEKRPACSRSSTARVHSPPDDPKKGTPCRFRQGVQKALRVLRDPYRGVSSTPAVPQVRRPLAASHEVRGDSKVAGPPSLPKHRLLAIIRTRCGSLVFPTCRLDLGTVAPCPRGFPSPVASSTLRYLLNLPVLRASFGDSNRCVPSFLARLSTPLTEVLVAFQPAQPDCLSWGCPNIALPPSKLSESSPSCLLPKEPAAFGLTPPSA